MVLLQQSLESVGEATEIATDVLVEVEHLRKIYGDLVAVDGVSFRVEAGTIFGLVGPNGAGKTTIVECIEGLRHPDGGKVRVFGYDPDSEHRRIYSQLGVQLQDNGLHKNIQVLEALCLFASMYANPLSADQLLEEFGLESKAKARYESLSGGQKRKLQTALALVGRPRLLILDEPTSGLDPQSRRDFWASLERYRRSGLAILLTTHDMREAEENCNVICIVDRGKVVTSGSPTELLEREKLGTRITVRVEGDGGLERGATVRQALEGLPGITRIEVAAGRLYLYGEGDDFFKGALDVLREQGLGEMSSRPANLEDLYLILTGRDYQKGETP